MFGIENMFLENLLQKSCVCSLFKNILTQEDEFATHLW